jgi:glucokinase
MNLDDLLRSAGDTPDRVVEPDPEHGLQRLRDGLRRLRDDPAEADRIQDLLDLVDADEDAYRSGREAIARQDLEAAERHLLRVAQRGHCEAAYWLALVLQLRCDRLRLAGRHREADGVATKAAAWLARARSTGAAQALENSPDEDEPAPGLSSPAEPPPTATSVSAATGTPHRMSSTPPAGIAATEPPDDRRYAVGVELRPHQFTAVLTSQDGEQIATRQRSLHDMDSTAVAAAIAATAKDMVTTLEPHIPRDRIALGLQVGGPVDAETGTVLFFSKHLPKQAESGTGFRWDDVPFGPMLQQATGLQTVVENDANAFAERERWLGAGQHSGDFAVVLLREGIGGSVVSNGTIFGGPVEIGQFIIYSGGMRPSDAGQLGTLEGTAGTTGIITETSERSGRAVIDIETAAALAEEPETAGPVVDAFTAAGIAIACGVGYLINFAGPSHVVLYGPAVMLEHGHRAADAFLGQVTQFRDFVAFEPHRTCELILRPLGPFDGAHGAALLGLQRCLGISPTPSTARFDAAGRHR